MTSRPFQNCGRAGAVVALVALLSACSRGVSVPVSRAAQTFPASSPTTGEPRQLDPVPAAGTVTVVDGPFTDRLALTQVRLEQGQLRLRLAVTSDVSELIDLELAASFYDAAGRLVSTGRTVYEEGDGASGHPSAETGGIDLEVSPDGDPSRVTSARLSVPVLVNE